MNAATLVALVRARATLRSHERWTRGELLNHQAATLAKLRAFAVARSPFYAELHRGLEDAPLEGLPVVTKAMLMDRFDDVVTDRDVRLAAVERYLATAAATDRFRNRYRVAGTGGTTGRRGLFLADRREWTTILASYARAYQWAGVGAGVRNRMRMAVVSSTSPTHQSSIVGATVASRFVPTLRLDATEPIEALVDALGRFQPDSLVGYASILRALADEQVAGRLTITPQAVMSASEILSDGARERIRAAFGIAPTNVYAATETAGIASECRRGHLHRYEDLVIAEIVDADNRPVPVGELGSRLLVTVLFARIQPLIRYELSDHVAADERTCPDGLPFGLLRRIEGREEETLALGGVRVHPNVFHAALERLPGAGWQVVDEVGRLHVMIARPAPGVDPDTVRAAVAAALAAVGVRGVAIEVSMVDAIPRTSLGKAPLVRRAQPSTERDTASVAR